MSYVAPVSESTGYVVTATDYNDFVAGDIPYLYGDSAWTAMSGLTNSWVSATGPAAYRRIGNFVVCRGAISTGTANTTAFTFPAGYRPAVNSQFIVWNNLTGPVGVNLLTVNTTGTLVPFTSVTSWLTQIVFPIV